MPVDNQASRFAAAEFSVSDVNLEAIQDKWEFVFRTLEQPHLWKLVIMTQAEIQPWVDSFLDNRLEVADDLVEAVDARMQVFEEELIQTCELLALSSDKNLDNPDSWRYMLSRLPLTPELMTAIELMTDRQRSDFSVGGDFEGLDPEGGLYMLNEMFPDAGIGNVTPRLNNLYIDLEAIWFAPKKGG